MSIIVNCNAVILCKNCVHQSNWPTIQRVTVIVHIQISHTKIPIYIRTHVNIYNVAIY